MRAHVMLTLLVMCSFTLAGATAAHAQTANSLPNCDAPEHHQFDFWIGSWDVFNAQGAKVGTNVVTQMLRGCTLHEHWEGTNGGVGESFSSYDRVVKHWHQTWVDNIGNVWKTDGDFDGARMVLLRSGPTPRDPSHDALHRWAWSTTDGDHVRQLYEVSVDNGTTWQTNFDGRYVRHK